MSLKAGPKSAIEAPPLDLSGWPRARAARRLKFIREYVVTPHGKGGGKPMKLRPWQREIIDGALGPGIRTAMVSMPRANGKTALAAALAVAELFVGEMSAEVLVVASDERQARIAVNMARRMIELSPELSERAHVYRDHIAVPENDATMRALPADAAALHGFSPTLLVIDELHVVTEEVWEAATSVSGKRMESLTLAISTPATSIDSIMFRLIEHGREGTDPSFYLREFSAPKDCDLHDRAAWAEANPALGDFLAEDGLASAARTLREPVFRQLRLGQWVTGAEGWLPFGAFGECIDTGKIIDDDEPVVLAFDGSASGDSTALIGCTVNDPHLFVIGLWENPGDPRWRVPRADVDAAVDQAFADFNVLELAADPWGWRSEIEAWADRHGEKVVLEWNTAAAGRMAPATDRMYQAVVNGEVSHDGNEDLAKHFAHCIAKRTPMGDLVSKDKKSSPRKIDAAVASIVALDRAAWHANNSRPKRRRLVSFAS